MLCAFIQSNQAIISIYLSQYNNCLFVFLSVMWLQFGCRNREAVWREHRRPVPLASDSVGRGSGSRQVEVRPEPDLLRGHLHALQLRLGGSPCSRH